MSDLYRDYELLVAAVREVGELALQHFRSDVKSWAKKGGTPVSDVDLAIDRILKERLYKPRQEYGWLSEETEDNPERLARHRAWVVDPIDGTRAFLEGLPQFCHSVALVEDGRPILAAIYNPATDELYDAIAGLGARLNGSLIHVSDRRDLLGCRMAAFEPLFRHPAWREPWPQMQIVQSDSVAYRLAMVASGKVDAAMGLNAKNDWDLAAADLIVCEAGGLVSAHDGRQLKYNTPTPMHRSFLAAGPALYDAIFARVGHVKLPPQQHSH